MDMTQLLTFAIDNGADEVLVSAGSPPILRKRGKLILTRMASLSADEAGIVITNALGISRTEVLDREREVFFTHQVRPDRQCMGSVYFERGCICGVFRIVPTVPELPAKIGIPSVVAEAARAPAGMLVIASPPGHGKSTTLASLVELINTERDASVLVIEERITHPHANRKSVIHQREVGRDVLSFRRALDAASRQEPDVLVIDPMNDPETIRQAVAFAGRGRLVIASLEADCVRDALERLLAAGAEQRTYSVSRQLGASLLLVAALRLLPRKDAPGRIPATEVLRVDADVASLVSQGDVEAIAGRETRPDESGAWTMDSFILKLHERGLVDAETARRHMINPAMLES